MIIIIDGYNVLKQVISHNKITTNERMKFIQRLAAYNKKKRHTIVVFFDGESSEEENVPSYEHISIIYAGYKYTADEYIKKCLEKHKNSEMLLVSSDRELNIYADNLNTPSLEATDFYHLLIQKNQCTHLSLSSHIKKTSERNTPELDYIMNISTENIDYKKEDTTLAPHRSSLKKLSKKERKLLNQLKKL